VWRLELPPRRLAPSRAVLLLTRSGALGPAERDLGAVVNTLVALGLASASVPGYHGPVLAPEDFPGAAAPTKESAPAADASGLLPPPTSSAPPLLGARSRSSNDMRAVPTSPSPQEARAAAKSFSRPSIGDGPAI
jgi:hypothetical protein